MLQKCKDSGFCQRLRGVNGTDAFAIRPESVELAGGAVHATVINKENVNGTFVLSLTAYEGIVRLHINEASLLPAAEHVYEKHADPAKRRYEVPDVLLPGLEKSQQVRAAY